MTESQSSEHPMPSDDLTSATGTIDRGALDDLLVLEIGDEATQFCGKLLADMGATVVKLEPPEGAYCRHRGPFRDDRADPNGSIYFWAYNTNKQSVTLDLHNAADLAVFWKLAARADVVLADDPDLLASVGIDHASLSARNPGVVTTWVTPFGTTGPRAGWKGCDLVYWATGGPMWLVGYTDPTTPPLAPQGDLSYQLSGHWACIGTLVALEARAGTGEGQEVDVSMQAACTLGVDGYDTAPFEYTGVITHRRDFPTVVTCADGVHIVPQMLNVPAERWIGFAAWIEAEHPGFEDARSYDAAALQADESLLLDVVGAVAAERSADEMVELGQTLGFTWMRFV
jgi:benzylsuccinate CoA-transferase BbsE subunit